MKSWALRARATSLGLLTLARRVLSSSSSTVSDINPLSRFELTMSYNADRLVDCPILRKAFEAFYTTVLPKHGHPFIYFSLLMDPEKIDVNVHPTKSEVFFLDDDEIVSIIIEELGKVLKDEGTSKKFGTTQQIASAKTPAARAPAPIDAGSDEGTPNRLMRSSSEPILNCLQSRHRAHQRRKLTSSLHKSSFAQTTKRKHLMPCLARKQTLNRLQSCQTKRKESAKRTQST